MKRFRNFLLSLTALCLFGFVAVRPALPQVLAKATSGQQQRFAPAFEEVDRWVKQKAFPGAVLAVGEKGKLVALKSFGKMDYSASAKPMPVDGVFDLASVTKVVGCTTAVAILYERKQIDLDAPVSKYLPEFAGVEGHELVHVSHLLSHSSGLQSQRVLWRDAKTGADVMKRLYVLPVNPKPGEVAQYRDYNMMLLGEIVHRVSGQRLDRFLQSNVFAPLGMKSTAYNPPAKWMARIPPTEQDNVLRHRMVRGVVHDENAFLTDGVSGHAGLFSSAPDLAVFAQMYLNGGVYRGKRILKEETIKLFMQRQATPATTTRALGWDTPGKGSFPGELASPRAVIHTGFTGTSIYIDPVRNAFIVLLTNRVHPTRENNTISKARPAIHTAVLSILDKK